MPSVQGLIDRAKAIILKPEETWPALAAEPATPGSLMMRWAVPLAAIGPVCSFLHGQLFGWGGWGIHINPGLVFGLTSMIVSYVLGLVGVVVLALIADWLAPNFGGVSDRTAAFKLVVFGSFAAWLAGAFQLLPGLGILGIVGLYSLYLYYTGAAPLMKVPQDKALGYTAVMIVCAIVLYLVVGVVTTSFLGMFGMGAASLAGGDSDARIEANIPGVGKINVDSSKMEQAAKQLEAAASGNVTPVDTAKLQALLPESLNGYSRTAIDTGAAGQMGKGVSATYSNGDKSIKLSVVDSTGLGALAGMAGVAGVESSHQDADGYEKTSTVDGQIQIEKWNNKDGRGEFTRQVGSRFFVSAEGEAGSIDDLKGAVGAIDPGTLMGLAK